MKTRDSGEDNKKYFRELLEMLRALAEDRNLLEAFFEDLLTPKELEEVSKRWQIVKLLDRNVPHHEIAKRLHAAVETVSRGAREMRDAKGGFRRALREL